MKLNEERFQKERKADLQRLKDIRYWARKATLGTEESKEAPQK